MASHETLPHQGDEDPEALVGFLERQLQSEPPPSAVEKATMKARLSALYLDKLGDPLAAAVHVEELLQGDTVAASVLEIAVSLLKCRPIAPRIAEKLSNAYARLDQHESEAAMLSVELTIAKPERLDGVRRRLALLRRERFGDAPGAMELLAPLVLSNPADPELLSRYADAAAAAEKIEEAVALLSSVRESATTPEAKVRLGHTLGVLYLQEGELPSARAAFLSAVVEKIRDDATLASARRLVALCRDPEDPDVLGPALDVLVEQEPEAAAQQEAAERRLALGGFGEDDPRAIPCWRALLDSPRAREALERLEHLYETVADLDGLAATLQVRALRASDPVEARALAFRSAELRTRNGVGGDAAIEAWDFVVQAFGPSRDVVAKLAPLLEREGRFIELCDLLEADAALSPPGEAAGLFARLGQIRLSRLGQEAAALAAFKKSLEFDPSNAVSRVSLEQLVLEGGQRLEAASALESASASVGSDEGLLAALETRAELAESPVEALDLLGRAVELAERAPERAARGLLLSGRALALSAAHRPELLPAWIERTRTLAEMSHDRSTEAAVLLQAVQAAPVDCDERCWLACEAIDVLGPLGRSGEALGLALRAFEEWPGSLRLSTRIDRLTEGREPPTDRLARYERTLEHLTNAADRVVLRHAMAELAAGALSDLAEAAAEWRAILAEDPSDARAQRALVEAYQRTGDESLLPADFGGLLSTLDGGARSAVLAGKVRSLIAKGERDQALQECRLLLEMPDAGDDALEAVASVAYEENEQGIYREALERLADSTVAQVRVQALERLGHYFEQAGDRRAAAESWKPAAILSAGDAEGDEHARELYERVLAAAPDDREAAERLLALYVNEGRWVNVPGIYAILLRSSTDPDAAANLLLSLEKGAVAGGAIDELVGMLDETLPYLGSTNETARRRLMQAKARVLAADEARTADAAKAYRAFVEAFGDDEAVAAFEAFIEARLESGERHAERRWLYEWRSTRAEPSVDALLAWAKAEEEHGEGLAAIRAVMRAAELEPGRAETHELLARLRQSQGDFEGAIAALRAFRELSSGEERQKIELRIAHLLGEELGRPEEALLAMAPLLSSSPPPAPAIEMARRALERSEELDRTVDIIEKASAASSDPGAAAANLELLLEAPLDEASLGERRESWIVKLAELRAADPEEALRVFTKGIGQNPGSSVLWDALVGLARRTKRADVVFEALSRALENPSVDAARAEELGKRAIAFYDEWSSDSIEVQKTLEAVLEHAPGARWALDRVKLLLFGSGRWPELFRIYDRAVDGARSPGERAELLDEAALAARDLARDADRAIGYLEQLRALRPTDAPVLSSLERLYERQGESAKLIALLSEREAGASGLSKEELEQRIAGLWLDLGDIGSAHTRLEGMLESGVRLADLVPLLERILGVRPEHDVFESPKSPHSRAVALLVEHFEVRAAIPDVIRVREAELSFARSLPHRTRAVQTLVALHLEAGGDTDDAFIGVVPKVEAFSAIDPILGTAAAAQLLLLAEEAWKRRGASPESGAAQAAHWAIRRLEDGSVRGGDAEGAARVLLEGARLPFVRERQRVLTRDAAIHLAERAGAPERAVELLRALFNEDPTDPVVSPQVDGFARLLEKATEIPERAGVWESLGQRAVELGQTSFGLDYFTRAAELWEALPDDRRAIAARRRSAALGSGGALEALARLHRERGEWLSCAEVLEWAFSAASADSKARLGSLLADAYLALGERERAAARLEEVLETAPSEDAVRERLAGIYREDGAFRPLAELLVRGASVASTPQQRLPMLREAAQVLMSKLSDPVRAIPILEAAVALAGTDSELSVALADALDAAGRYRDAAKVLREELGRYGDLRPKSRAPIHHRLAQVFLHLSSSREALVELRAAVDIDPSNPEMLYDLARRALGENQLELAESTYRALLLTLHRAAPGEGPSRVEVYLDLSEVAARRDDHARAADYIESSFDVSLEGLEEALSLEKALARRGREDLVARSVERRLRAARDPAAAAHALAELVRLHGANAGNVAELPTIIARHAAEIRKQVEQTGATDAEIWATLAAAARVSGGDAARTEVLAHRIELLLEKAENADDGTALELLREAAVACAHDLSDRDRGRRSYEALLARFPADWASWDAVFELAVSPEDVERVGGLVEKAIADVASAADRSRLRLGYAKILLGQPDHVQRATRVLEEVLDEEPGHADAAELLADALEAEGRNAELVKLLEERIRVAMEGGGDAPIVLTLRLGAALERAGKKKRAIGVYDALVADESVDIGTLHRVREKLEVLSSPSLANAIERILEMERDAGSAALAKRLVELREQAKDEAGALRAAAIGFELDPADASLRERLLADAEARGLPDRALDVLRRAVAAAPDDRPLFLAWIDAVLKSGDWDGAVRALDHALEVSPTDTELLRERSRAKQAGGRDEEALVDLEHGYALDPSFAFEMRGVLERLVEGDLPARDRYVLALVDVLVEQEEQGRAGELLDRFLAERPEHVGGLERLAALRAADQDWPAAIAAYERLLPLIGGDHELFARLSLEFAEACDRAGGSAQARAALERAYEHAPDRNDLRERLEAIYEVEGDRARLTELLLAGAARADEPARKAAFFFRAAELLLKEEDGAEKALGAVTSGRAVDPVGLEGSLLHAKILRALDRDDEALAQLLALVERSRGKLGVAISPVHLEIARIYLEADYLHEGFDALKLAFQFDPRSTEAAYLLGLAALDLCDDATASRAFRAVTATRDEKVSHETKAMAFYHMARLAQWKGDKRRAQTMAKSALQENPGCDVASALLAALGR